MSAPRTAAERLRDHIDDNSGWSGSGHSYLTNGLDDLILAVAAEAAAAERESFTALVEAAFDTGAHEERERIAREAEALHRSDLPTDFPDASRGYVRGWDDALTAVLAAIAKPSESDGKSLREGGE